MCIVYKYCNTMNTCLVINSANTGKVIGRAGANIKKVQLDSGATIKIVDGDTPEQSKISISGTEEAQLEAKNIIGNMIKIMSSYRMPAVQQSRPKPKRPARRNVSPEEKLHLTDEQWAEITKENEERTRLVNESLPPIKKDFYVEHNQIKKLTEEDVQAFRLENNNIMVQYVEKSNDSRPIPKPIIKFEHAFHTYPKILEIIRKQKFEKPSSIQCQAWPIILSGHDLIGIAQTGTGKTLAFILPAIIHLLQQPTPREKRIGPTVLILGPTRELVLQIEEEIKKYIFNGIKVISVYGGVSIENQEDYIVNQKPEIIVATPGRLRDLVERMTLKLQHVSYMVFDEADRMLDMGFKNQIELSLSEVRYDRQTILTSATWPPKVRDMAKMYTTNPLHITIGSIDLNTVTTVKQEIIMIEENKKLTWLENFIPTLLENDKVIIFTRKKVTVEKIYNKLKKENIECR